MKIEFAPIDARDGIVGYDTVGFIDDKGRHLHPATPEVYLLRERMQAEYMTRLHALQLEIKEKYAPLVTEAGLTDDYAVRDSVADPIWQSVRAQVRQEFPGPQASYYT